LKPNNNNDNNFTIIVKKGDPHILCLILLLFFESLLHIYIVVTMLHRKAKKVLWRDQGRVGRSGCWTFCGRNMKRERERKVVENDNTGEWSKKM
jgi:hypothetical protein